MPNELNHFIFPILLTYNVHQVEVCVRCQAGNKTAEGESGHALGENGREVAGKAAEVGQDEGGNTANLIGKQTVEKCAHHGANKEQRLANTCLVRRVADPVKLNTI